MHKIIEARFCRPAIKSITREWLWAALLISPFLVTTLWLLISGREYDVFWAEDERDFHYPLILEFARQWPFFDFHYELSATTPLVHLLGATLVKIFGAKIELLRVCNTIASALGILFLHRFLRKERGLSRPDSVVGAAVLMLSCYFFGFSFRVTTDNLALVFCLLAMGALHRFMSRPGTGLGAYLAGCLWLGLAVFSRQSYVFLCLPFAVSLLLRSDFDAKVRAKAFGALGLALVPSVSMFVLWKGVVPPLQQIRCIPGGFPFHLHSIAMPLCILGFYTFFFRAPDLLAWANGGWRTWSTRSARAAMAVVVLSLVCSTGLILWSSRTPDHEIYSGVLNTVGQPLPHILGTSVPTWLLLQAGLAAFFFTLIQGSWLRCEDAGKTIGFLCFAAICLVSLTNSVASQKYYDGQVLACLLWAVRPDQAANWRWKWGMWMLIGLFCSYHLVRQWLG